MIPAVASNAAQASGFDVKFSGVIQALPSAGGSTWMIGGLTVGTTAATQIRLEGVAEARVGMWADVTAQRERRRQPHSAQDPRPCRTGDHAGDR